jgi:hypothetical protein
MAIDIRAEVDAVQQIGAVPKILDVVARMTGMGFVAIARVTSEQWVCCAVRDNINFGLEEGGELQLETTICNEIRQHGRTVVINDVQTDGTFCNHRHQRCMALEAIFLPRSSLATERYGARCVPLTRSREN